MCRPLRVWLDRIHVLYSPKQRQKSAPLLLRHAARVYSSQDAADAAVAAADAAVAAADAAVAAAALEACAVTAAAVTTFLTCSHSLALPAVATVVAARGKLRAQATTRPAAVAAPIAAGATPKTAFRHIRAKRDGSGNGRRKWI